MTNRKYKSKKTIKYKSKKTIKHGGVKRNVDELISVPETTLDHSMLTARNIMIRTIFDTKKLSNIEHKICLSGDLGRGSCNIVLIGEFHSTPNKRCTDILTLFENLERELKPFPNKVNLLLETSESKEKHFFMTTRFDTQLNILRYRYNNCISKKNCNPLIVHWADPNLRLSSELLFDTLPLYKVKLADYNAIITRHNITDEEIKSFFESKRTITSTESSTFKTFKRKKVRARSVTPVIPEPYTPVTVTEFDKFKIFVAKPNITEAEFNIISEKMKTDEKIRHLNEDDCDTFITNQTNVDDNENLRPWMYDLENRFNSTFEDTGPVYDKHTEYFPKNRFDYMNLLTQHCVIMKEIKKAQLKLPGVDLKQLFMTLFQQDIDDLLLEIESKRITREEEFTEQMEQINYITIGSMLLRLVIDYYMIARIIHFDMKNVIVYAGSKHTNHLKSILVRLSFAIVEDVGEECTFLGKTK